MKFETVRIHFWSAVSVCGHPEILLPWQRDVTNFPLRYCKGLAKTNKVMKVYVTFSSTFLFLTSGFLLCPFPSIKPRAFPIAWNRLCISSTRFSSNWVFFFSLYNSASWCSACESFFLCSLSVALNPRISWLHVSKERFIDNFSASNLPTRCCRFP